MGETAGLSLSGAAEGLISGVSAGGEDAVEAGEAAGLLLPLLPPALPLVLALGILPQPGSVIRGSKEESRGEGSTHANLPAVCFVTAAAMPPFSLACFLSFLEAGRTVMVSSPLLLGRVALVVRTR